MILKRITAIVSFTLLAAITLWAQGGTGQITGTVTDPNGAVPPAGTTVGPAWVVAKLYRRLGIGY